MATKFNELHWSKDREKQETLLALKKKGIGTTNSAQYYRKQFGGSTKSAIEIKLRWQWATSLQSRCVVQGLLTQLHLVL